MFFKDGRFLTQDNWRYFICSFILFLSTLLTVASEKNPQLTSTNAIDSFPQQLKEPEANVETPPKSLQEWKENVAFNRSKASAMCKLYSKGEWAPNIHFATLPEFKETVKTFLAGGLLDENSHPRHPECMIWKLPKDLKIRLIKFIFHNHFLAIKDSL